MRVTDAIIRRRTRSARRSAGITLTEVVVASSLLVVAIVPILQALSAATLTGTKIERKTRSLALAQSKLDEIRARSIYRYSGRFRESSSPLGSGYLCSVTDDAHPRLRQIAVSVGYDVDGDGSLSASEVDVTLTTSIARRL